MSWLQRELRDGQREVKPLYNVSRQEASVQRRGKRTTTRPPGGAWRDASGMSEEEQDRRVHLVNADTLVSMVHDLCQQVSECHDRIHILEAREQSNAISPGSAGGSPLGSADIKLDALAKQLRSLEASGSSREVQHDMELREVRAKITQLELLTSLPAFDPPQLHTASPTLPATLYDPHDKVPPADPFLPPEASRAKRQPASVSQSDASLATYCKLLQRDLLDTIAEQARQKQVVQSLRKAVEGAEQNLMSLRDYVVRLTSLGFPETTSATGFACAAHSARDTASSASGAQPPLLVSLFQRITEVDHRLSLVERDTHVRRSPAFPLPCDVGGSSVAPGTKVTLGCRLPDTEAQSALAAMLDDEEAHVSDVTESVAEVVLAAPTRPPPEPPAGSVSEPSAVSGGGSPVPTHIARRSSVDVAASLAKAIEADKALPAARQDDALRRKEEALAALEQRLKDALGAAEAEKDSARRAQQELQSERDARSEAEAEAKRVEADAEGVRRRLQEQELLLAEERSRHRAQEREREQEVERVRELREQAAREEDEKDREREREREEKEARAKRQRVKEQERRQAEEAEEEKKKKKREEAQREESQRAAKADKAKAPPADVPTGKAADKPISLLLSRLKSSAEDPALQEAPKAPAKHTVDSDEDDLPDDSPAQPSRPSGHKASTLADLGFDSPGQGSDDSDDPLTLPSD